MPEKSLTLAYAAGASLAAITLVYVFAPTYFLDGEPSVPASGGIFSTRRKGAVGLSNAANDCFINSVLQALTGLGELRLYLIRETYRRELDDGSVYLRRAQHGADGEKDSDSAEWKQEGLQSGIVTRGLKKILDALNERPLHRKTITAAPFIRTLETAFRQRISRQQQDAQEFLQVIAERLCDEYHAGRKARRLASRNSVSASVSGRSQEDDREDGEREEDEREDGFPFQGKSESQIECLTCGFKPRPTETSFCMLVLNVPQVPSTTLGTCFDGMFKTEYIDGFRCEKCRLVHALELLQDELFTSPSAPARSHTRAAMTKLQQAIDMDPEKPPAEVTLPDRQLAPKRRIARHMRLTGFPSILAIHLSRSIYDPGAALKNAAKVAFPERLPLGGLLERRRSYKLLGLVTHKGSHYSGHYESFRRQNVYPPFSNPNACHAAGPYGKAPTARAAALETKGAAPTPTDGLGPFPSKPNPPNPQSLGGGHSQAESLVESPVDSPAPSSTSQSHPISIQPSASVPAGERDGERERDRDRDPDSSSLRSVAASARSTLSRMRRRPRSRAKGSQNAPPSITSLSGGHDALDTTPSTAATRPRSKRDRHQDRWWRISDDKIKEASTRDVLTMQREVYLLFYELDRSHHA